MELRMGVQKYEGVFAFSFLFAGGMLGRNPLGPDAHIALLPVS